MGVTIDRELWRRATGAIARACRRFGRAAGGRFVFGDALVVRMYLWSAWHDRPLCWACDGADYNTLFRPRALPSVSQFTRRVETASVLAVLQRVHDDLAAAGPPRR
jgi:hypothetical protein